MAYIVLIAWHNGQRRRSSYALAAASSTTHTTIQRPTVPRTNLPNRTALCGESAIIAQNSPAAMFDTKPTTSNAIPVLTE